MSTRAWPLDHGTSQDGTPPGGSQGSAIDDAGQRRPANVERSAVNASAAVDHATVMRAVAAFVIYQLSFYLAYRYGMTFSHAIASPFWFPDSVLLCALLLTPTRWWWAFVPGALRSD